MQIWLHLAIIWYLMCTVRYKRLIAAIYSTLYALKPILFVKLNMKLKLNLHLHLNSNLNLNLEAIQQSKCRQANRPTNSLGSLTQYDATISTCVALVWDDFVLATQTGQNKTKESLSAVVSFFQSLSVSCWKLRTLLLFVERKNCVCQSSKSSRAKL